MNKPSLIITEFPGNPLLQSPPLDTLRALSLENSIPLVVDDTVGTYTSLALLPHCDAACTSLTKMFSGKCNVMGGAVVLNPRGRWYAPLKGLLSGGGWEGRHGGRGEYGDINGGHGVSGGIGGGAEKGLTGGEGEHAWFWEDVLVMEKNSRGFDERVRKASLNAERMVEVLRESDAVAEVYYPKGSSTQKLYERFKKDGGAYGFLVSINFVAKEAAVAFYDALDVAKGPSLGTDFTLCCAYTLLAHYKELEWAAEYGVVEDLVRISVGLEEWEWLEERVNRALRAAEGVMEIKGSFE